MYIKLLLKCALLQMLILLTMYIFGYTHTHIVHGANARFHFFWNVLLIVCISTGVNCSTALMAFNICRLPSGSRVTI